MLAYGDVSLGRRTVAASVFVVFRVWGDYFDCWFYGTSEFALVAVYGVGSVVVVGVIVVGCRVLLIFVGR